MDMRGSECHIRQAQSDKDGRKTSRSQGTAQYYMGPAQPTPSRWTSAFQKYSEYTGTRAISSTSADIPPSSISHEDRHMGHRYQNPTQSSHP